MATGADPHVVLTQGAAFGSSFLFTFVFVGGFYLFKENPAWTNDHPEVIKRRIISTFITCFLALTFLFYLDSQLHFTEKLDISIFTLLGFRWEGLLAALFLPLLWVMILFLGPLVLSYYDQELPFQASFSFESDFKETFTSLIGWRNYIIGPLVEEFVFRSCILSVMYLAGYSHTSLIFGCPLFFGIAHLHHIRDSYKKSQLYGKRQNNLRNAITKSLFQFAYSTLFGWISSFIFLRTGHLVAPFLCHAFCNLMGFPAFDRISEYPHRFWVIWGAFVIGVVLFFILMFPMTDPTLYNSFYWQKD